MPKLTEKKQYSTLSKFLQSVFFLVFYIHKKIYKLSSDDVLSNRYQAGNGICLLVWGFKNIILI